MYYTDINTLARSKFIFTDVFLGLKTIKHCYQIYHSGEHRLLNQRIGFKTWTCFVPAPENICDFAYVIYSLSLCFHICKFLMVSDDGKIRTKVNAL